MKTTILMLVLAAATVTSTMAGSFSGLCDTGVVTGCASQTPLTANTADGNFTVTVSPVGTPPFSARTIPSSPGYFTSGGNPIGTATSSWITTATGTPPTETTAIGTFNYQEAITANVTGLVTITGNYGADNCANIAWGSTPVAVTGTNVSIGGGIGANCTPSSTAPFTALTAFSFQESVVSGTTYFLDFEVGNTGSVTGLLVDGLSATGGSTSATPEPSSVLLTLTGFALICGIIVRRSQAGNKIRS